ncbi:hypothetical protein GCM10007927_39770 [Sulfitobacter pacificus]|uniref:Uncharacterized protein n=1 Tax=Sulfitobacter pacificus TaxID=1499314 RepID=A0ABQ5VPT3_9RHOB|nr:hypothetical protein GCM10007927_39770 [Sulfitobacter pacificus]
MERVPPSSMQDNQVEKAPEICVQDACDDKQSERPSRLRRALGTRKLPALVGAGRTL